jgi:hypothetical protein
MCRQAKLRNLLWMGVSLLLIMTPLHPVRGQEVTASDGAGEEIIEVAPNEEGEALIEGETATLASDVASLPTQVFLPLVQGSGNETDEVVAAFTNSWTFDGCVSVPNSNAYRGLWDDAPGAGVSNESAFFWLITDETIDETCGYSSTITGGAIPTNFFQQLRLRVAVSDRASFRINVYQVNGASCTFLTGFTTPIANSNSAFYTYNVALPAGYTICRVQITLGDTPDTVNSGRATALIDDIQIRSISTGAIGWGETFSN